MLGLIFMPPRKKNQSKASKQAPSAAGPAVEGLPCDVIEHVGRSLIKQDKLNNVWSCARDVANLAMTSK